MYTNQQKPKITFKKWVNILLILLTIGLIIGIVYWLNDKIEQTFLELKIKKEQLKIERKILAETMINGNLYQVICSDYNMAYYSRNEYRENVLTPVIINKNYVDCGEYLKYHNLQNIKINTK